MGSSGGSDENCLRETQWVEKECRLEEKLADKNA